MGGDSGPEIIMQGIIEARERYPGINYRIFGPSDIITPLIESSNELAQYCELVDCDSVVSGTQSVSQALRQGKESSMWRAIKSVKNGESHGVVSAGNTGALMAMSTLTLRTLQGIDRPAMCSLFPSKSGEIVMLDLGANAVCNERNLVEFAIMGCCFAKAISDLTAPQVGLLNIGSEELKGTDTLRNASKILRETDLDLDFYGFIEGNDITLGTVDVVVTDGFSGNIALKTAEGTSKLYTYFLKSAFKSSLLAKIGYLFVRPALKLVMARTDPRKYNGALFVGLNGIVVKSHGGTDALGFSNAIGVAIDMVERDLNNTIADELINLELRIPVSSKTELLK